MLFSTINIVPKEAASSSFRNDGIVVPAAPDLSRKPSPVNLTASALCRKTPKRAEPSPSPDFPAYSSCLNCNSRVYAAIDDLIASGAIHAVTIKAATRAERG